jgi:hypothetical protein
LVKTLGAAYYPESGRFPEAIHMVEKAAALGSESGRAGLDQHLIELHRADKRVSR